MARLSIFASFEFDKDKKLKNEFFGEAKTRTQHRVRNCSLREAYPTQEWKDRAREAIHECDIVIVLVGQDTHNAPGVRDEVDIARSLRKPVFQIRRRKDNYTGVSGLESPIPWRWKRINQKIDELTN